MSVPEPGKILTPWATSGLKNAIPPTANPVTGNAGYDQGFPAINMTAKEAGGIPPFGQDFNGIFYEVTNILRYMQAGGMPTFSSAMSSAVGGYGKGAVVLGADGLTVFQSAVDGNTADPNSGGAGWVKDVLSSYPVGAPIPWPTAVPPPGFIAMIGQSFSATTYPNLALAYPALVLPDMRARTVRGLDAGRGVDPGRVVLSDQGDAIRNITGTIGNVVAGTINTETSGVFVRDTLVTGSATSGTANGYSRFSFDASRVVPTASENRVSNVAFLYIVRAA